MILEEKDKRIESLENDLKKADLDKENLKQMHNNYFLQVLTLINQRAISASSGSTRNEEKPVTKTEKGETVASLKTAQKEDKPAQIERHLKKRINLLRRQKKN